MQTETLKAKLAELDGLISEAKKQKVSDDKLLASGREELNRLETQLSQVRNDAEEAKSLMAKEKKSLGLKLIQQGEEAFKEAMSEIKEMELKELASKDAIAELEKQRDDILNQVANLRLKTEIPQEQKGLHKEGLEVYKQFKESFAECQKYHAQMKQVASDLNDLGHEYNSVNTRTGNQYKHLKFNFITPFDKPEGAGVQFFDNFKTFVERQATMVKDGRVVLSE